MGHRYNTLEGLRGLAALAVVIYHGRTMWGDWRPESAFLAVDLFFGLSGFVIAHAYDERLANGMRVLEFMRRRVVRLFPFYALGLLIGAAGAIAVSSKANPLICIPVNAAYLPCGSEYLFPFNQPAWSLMDELLANLLFAGAYVWLRGKGLVLLVIATGACLLMVGDYDGGANWHDWYVGLLRVAFGFSAGVFIYRSGARVTLGNAWAPMLLLMGVLVLPASTGISIVSVFVIFPLLIAWGAGVEPEKPTPFIMLGAISYGVYALHGPLMQIAKRLLAGPLLMWSGPLFLLGLSILVLALNRWFDAPARSMLAKGRLPLLARHSEPLPP